MARWRARFSDAVKIDFENEKEVETFQQSLYHYENQFDVGVGRIQVEGRIQCRRREFRQAGAAFG